MARTSTTKTLNTTPPKTVANAAARGLRLREQHGRGGTAIGVARARDLSIQKQLSAQTIRRMHAYFARHSVDKTGKGWADRTKPSAGYIAWLLWGGDAGQRWAERLHARLQEGDNKQAGAATKKAASTKSFAKKARRKQVRAPPRRTAEHVQPRRSARHPARARQRKPLADARHSRAACGRAPPRRWLPTRQQATRRLPRNPPARGLHPGKSPTRPRHPGHCRLRRKPKPRPAPRLQAALPQPGRQHGGCEAIENQQGRGVGAPTQHSVRWVGADGTEEAECTALHKDSVHRPRAAASSF